MSVIGPLQHPYGYVSLHSKSPPFFLIFEITTETSHLTLQCQATPSVVLRFDFAHTQGRNPHKPMASYVVFFFGHPQRAQRICAINTVVQLSEVIDKLRSCQHSHRYGLYSNVAHPILLSGVLLRARTQRYSSSSQYVRHSM